MTPTWGKVIAIQFVAMHPSNVPIGKIVFVNQETILVCISCFICKELPTTTAIFLIRFNFADIPTPTCEHPTPTTPTEHYKRSEPASTAPAVGNGILGGILILFLIFFVFVFVTSRRRFKWRAKAGVSEREGLGYYDPDPEQLQLLKMPGEKDLEED